MSFRILTSELFVDFTLRVTDSPSGKLNRMPRLELPVDYFQFCRSVSSVYSSKIEGEDIDFDSYFKYRFMNISFKSDYTKKSGFPSDDGSIPGRGIKQIQQINAKIQDMNTNLLTGVICGYRVAEIEDPLTRQVRYLDKLVDELAKGRKMEKILRF